MRCGLGKELNGFITLTTGAIDRAQHFEQRYQSTNELGGHMHQVSPVHFFVVSSGFTKTTRFHHFNGSGFTISNPNKFHHFDGSVGPEAFQKSMD